MARERVYTTHPLGTSHLSWAEITSGEAAEIPQEVNELFVGFVGDTADAEFTFEIALQAYDGGPDEYVCSGSGTIGTQAMGDKKLADTLATTSLQHVSDVKLADNSGDNRFAKLCFDAIGAETIKVTVTGNATPIIRGI